MDVHAGQAGGGYGHRRLLFHLAAAADDAAAGAAQGQGLRPQQFAHQVGQVGVVGGVLGGGENHGQVGGGVAEIGADGSGALGQRGAQTVLLGKRRSPLHN